ncbi:MAG: bifunctional UDP-N-acetylglucosamine diphosphorylase/glucosamine-1-phosphate N-acetyltransferase GlmU [Clostridiales bacterium]|nr:bifunctional UDP-N-acetylglucosamine diphosphorylase/glucosamine-1-phosphate N-acetyltransferase GlmU [Clostridiales bacterium]
MGATALVLAAGEGTRMKSDLPKVAHSILGIPMVGFVVDAARDAGCERVVVITGHGADLVESLLSGVEFARQDRRLGTGHAVMCAQETLIPVRGSLVVLSGDTPLVRPQTIAALIAQRERHGAGAAVLTALMPDPAGYGRIVRDEAGEVTAIIEQKECTPEQAKITEVNTGTYCFDAEDLFGRIDRLTADNAQAEFYLTDMIALMHAEGLGVVPLVADDARETLGVNSRIQLAEASSVLQERINARHMLAGVTMIDPRLVWIGPHVEMGRDVVIEPMTFVLGSSTVGDRTVLGPNTRITDSKIGADAVVDSSVVLEAAVGPHARVGPVAYLRPGTVLADGAKAGTCVEIKNSTIGEGSKVPHLSYIGDAEIGRKVNVGAGTITCNYDGARKHRTTIKDGAFIGSDTMLVAPVTIGEGAVTAAASAISHDVPPGSLAIERCEQRVVEGWVARRTVGDHRTKGE